MKFDKIIFKDIRFWIIIFFIIRLYGITNPPLEIGHNWRQTTVTSVARNFFETDNNILYPRIDIAGEKTGITGMEFPIINYLIYLVSKIFGYQHWYGRLINLIVSSFGIWVFFLLVKKISTKDVAFYSSFILLASIWFSFSRKIMPDTFSMSFMIFSVFYGIKFFIDNYSFRNNFLNLFLYSLFLSIALLSKLPSGYILILLSLFIFNKKFNLTKKIIFIFSSIVFLVPIIYWYFVWVPYLVEKFEFWHFFMGKSFLEGAKEIFNNINPTLSRFYQTAFQFVGFFSFLLGIFYCIKNNQKLYIKILVLAFIGFSMIIFKSGFTFYHHNYYIIPFVPVMALIAGYGLDSIKNKKIAFILLLAIAFENIANQYQDFIIKDEFKKLENLESDLNKYSNNKDLIAINSDNNPTAMYFAHRKGWLISNNDLQNADFIKNLKKKELKYIVVLKNTFGSDIDYDADKLIFENESYKFYKLNNK